MRYPIRLLVLIIFILSFLPSFSQNSDINLLREIHMGRNEALDPAFKLVSKTTTAISLAVPITVYTIGKINDDELTLNNSYKAGLAIGTSMVVSTVMKYTIKRSRPYEKYPDIKPLSDDFTSSFPSGHTTSAFCTATSLSLMYPKWYVIVPSYTYAVAVGYSRLHMGMHYPSDVIVGAIIGTGISFLSFKVQKWVGN